MAENKMKYAFSLFMLFFVFLCLNATSATDTQITTDIKEQTDPAVSGDTIVYVHEHSATDHDIYKYNPSTGNTIIEGNSYDQLNPDIDSNDPNRVVWQDNRNGNWDIYYKVGSNAATKISNDGDGGTNYDDINPRIVSNYIVYERILTTADHDIRLYNTNDGTTKSITTRVGLEEKPVVSASRNTVVWQDNRNGNWDIYKYDLNTNTESSVYVGSSDQINPSIWANKIVWQDEFYGASDSDICMYDMDHPGIILIADSTLDEEDPSITDGYVAYDVWNGADWDVKVVNTNLNNYQSEHVVTGSNQAYPKLSTNGKLVWQDRRNGNADIYTADYLDLKGLFNSVTWEAGYIITNDAVINPSKFDIGGFYVTYYLSPDTNPSNFVTLGSRYLTGISAGSTSTASTVLGVPFGVSVPGKYLVMSVDSHNQIAEFDETTNNLVYRGIVYIDLVATTVRSTQTSYAKGGVIAVEAFVKNCGNTASSSFATDIWLYSTNSGGIPRYYIGTMGPSGSVAAGITKYLYNTFTIPANIILGNYYLVAVPDPGNTVAESDETNNKGYSLSAVSVQNPFIDLAATSVIPKVTTIARGVKLSYDVFVKNLGNSVSPGFSADVWLCSTNTYGTPRYYVGTVGPAGSVAPGITRFMYGAATIPLNVIPGSYYLAAYPDPNNAIAESNESNNRGYSTNKITIT